MLSKLRSLVVKPSGGTKVRVKTPTVLQLEAVECGAASLAMVLGYYGRIVPLTTLRQECGVSRDGSKASNIAAAARRFGMNAKGFAKSIDNLKKMKFPVIIFWNFNHFVTVEGYDDKNFFLNDPAAGHRTVDAESFGRQFTGITLQLEPGPDFVKEGKRPSLIDGIRKRMKGSGLGALFVFLIGLLLVIPGLAVPAFNQIFIDRIILDSQSDWLRPLILAMTIAVVLQALLRFMQLRYLRRLRMKLTVLMSSSYIWHLLRLPASFYSQRYPGEVANRSQLNEKLANILSGQLAQTAIDVIMMVFYAALMFSYDIVLTLIGITFALVNIFILRWSGKNRVESNMRVLQEYGKAQGVAVAGLQGIETIKSGGLESGFFGQWAGYYAKGSNARQDLELSNRVLDVAPSLLNSLATASVLIIGAFRVISGDITIGMLVAYQSLMQSFLAPVSTLMSLGGTIQELRGDLERIDDVLAAPTVGKPIEKTTKEAASLPKLSGKVEVKNLTFGYSPREPALIENFNVSIKPGSWVALVGGSGSGKTTIARIISGEYEPWEGEVLFDDKPLEEIHNLQITKSIATVDQEISLFRGNVRDNLTLWDSKIDDVDIKRACEDAVILEVVQNMPGGLDADLIEGGANLSGGQRQRLEIARSLVRDPSIILFDEATSALDSETEQLVMDRIRARGSTAIIVAHRLSTIRDCDEIIVMDKGKIKERGTHSDLWNADGHYRQLMMADQ